MKFTEMRFLSLILTLTISSVLSDQHSKSQHDREKINLQEIAEEVNSDHTRTWKADAYGYSEIGVNEIKRKLGAKLHKNDESTSNKFSKSKFSANGEPKLGANLNLPISYDARQQYPECTSISLIRDQSNCAADWAISTVSTLSDRLCIKSGGRYNYELSSRYIIACDKEELNYGCDGGYADLAWDFLQKNGTVSGGEFESDEGCQPYPIQSCGWPKKSPCHLYTLTPKCLKYKCDNENYKYYPAEKNVIKAGNLYKVDDGDSGKFNEYFIREEIFLNGSVQAGFDVRDDFLTYKSGIYITRTMYGFGYHTVRIIGWGEEKGVKYWLIANSWGDEWGENGTFRMLRGRNHCGIEMDVYASTPIID